jgi:hypothetical protein
MNAIVRDGNVYLCGKWRAIVRPKGSSPHWTTYALQVDRSENGDYVSPGPERDDDLTDLENAIQWDLDAPDIRKAREKVILLAQELGLEGDELEVIALLALVEEKKTPASLRVPGVRSRLMCRGFSPQVVPESGG